MTRFSFVLGFLALGCLALGADPRFFAPVFLRPGSVNEVYGWDEDPVVPFTVEVWRNGAQTALLGTRSFAVNRPLEAKGPGNRPLVWSAALVCPDALDEPGPVTVRFLGPGRKLLASVASRIVPRTFNIETIPLTTEMSQLREKPDPRKEREFNEIWAVYTTFHPDFPWASGRFSLPVDPRFSTSAQFGDTRKYVYTDGTSSRDYHRGIDFAVPQGTEVRAPAPGRVALVADRMLTGHTVVIEHAPGLYSVYFHLSKVLVTRGQAVVPGDLIALSGATGLVTGPHLHWEFRCGGVSVDPSDFVLGSLLDIGTVNAVISSSERTIH